MEEDILLLGLVAIGGIVAIKLLKKKDQSTGDEIAGIFGDIFGNGGSSGSNGNSGGIVGDIGSFFS